MSREENIETLKEHLEHWKHLLSEKICDQSEGEKTIDALQNAIKALEREQCEDFIRRQAVLELVADYDLSMGQVVKGIHALPSVSPIPKWIPVSERYPKDGQRVLVDYCDEDAEIMLIRLNINGYRGFKAWMPLQTPYQPEIPTGAEGSDKE